MSSVREERGEALNTLLRGEISAGETYKQAIDKAGDDPRASELRRMCTEHESAATQLRLHVSAHSSEEPDESSGAWGAWAKTVQGTMNLFGDKASLKALKEGEEHGVKEYEDALEEDSLSADCRELIRGTLLPQTREHINTLDRLMDAM